MSVGRLLVGGGGGLVSRLGMLACGLVVVLAVMLRCRAMSLGSLLVMVGGFRMFLLWYWPAPKL